MEPEVTSNENVNPSPVVKEGGVRDVNQSSSIDPSTGRTATDTAGEKPETNAAESKAPNAPKEEDKKSPAPVPFEIQVDPSHAMAGREMAAIAPKVDDGSRKAYHELRAEASENTAPSSPKMGNDGAGSTNQDK